MARKAVAFNLGSGRGVALSTGDENDLCLHRSQVAAEFNDEVCQCNHGSAGDRRLLCWEHHLDWFGLWW